MKAEEVVLDEDTVEIVLQKENSQKLANLGFRVQGVEDEPSVLRILSVPELPYDKILQPKQDVAELCSQLKNYGGVIVTPLRAFWHSAATLACRKSIMIGKALDHATMVRVVSNLQNLHHPWNCPHGRPTVRHVASIGSSSSTDNSSSMFASFPLPK